MSIQAIKALLKEKNGILLAHNYQPPQIQEMADMCGDSLELSIRAARTDADIIVFCGVHFMAETAAILSPDKTVLLPNPEAGCPMADMITPEALQRKLAEIGTLPVVTYVNSPASVKALSTICCTSANAPQVVESLDADELLMAPDRNLARYTASLTDKKIHYWEGYCPFHDRLTSAEIQAARDAHPKAVVMAHPECRPEVLALADVVKSTSGMLQYASQSSAAAFIVGTEIGMLYPLQKANPGKSFYPAAWKMECADMKKIEVEDVLESLETGKGRVEVSPSVRQGALKAVRAMIALSRHPD